jgi:diaminopimelate epimerase
MTNTNIPFAKMHGAGNDYVLVAERDLPRDANLPDLARAMSDRRTGIGSDGLIVVRASPAAAARMEMYNSDGTRSAMCGNGLRLVAKFLADRGELTGDAARLESDAGVHGVALERRGGAVVGARIEMGEPVGDMARIPLADPKAAAGPGGFPTIDVAAGGRAKGTCLSMGNPHCVIFVDDVESAPVAALGAALERDPRFPDRTNVEFAQIRSRGEIAERTWERGAGETWACGSGACAAAVAAIAAGRAEPRVRVRQRGGDLEVEWHPGGVVHLSGPAELAFVGNWRAREGARPGRR